MNQINVTIPFLQHCIDSNLLTPLCHFIKLKTKHKNSCYYGRSISNIARHNNNSTSTISKYIETFIYLGWCRYHGNNIIFNSIEGIMALHGIKANTYISLEADTTQTHNTKLAIRKLLFENNLRRQQYIIGKRCDLQNPANLRTYKAANKVKTKYKTLQQDFQGENNLNLQCTVHGLSDIWNCSIATATRIKKQFIANGWYKFLKRYSIVCHFVSKHYYTFFFQQEHPSRSYYWFKGTIYQSLPSIVVLPYINPINSSIKGYKDDDGMECNRMQ